MSTPVGSTPLLDNDYIEDRLSGNYRAHPYQLYKLNTFDQIRFIQLVTISKSGRHVIRFANGEKISGRNRIELYKKYKTRVSVSKTLAQLRFAKHMSHIKDPFGIIAMLGKELVSGHVVKDS